MNTSEPYARRLDRTIPDPAPTPDAERAVDLLAVHRDPSAQSTKATKSTDRSQTSVAWIRPSEMPALIGSKVVGRGIDLRSELARRARRAPGGSVSTTSRRITRTSIARPDISTPTIANQEGLGL